MSRNPTIHEKTEHSSDVIHVEGTSTFESTALYNEEVAVPKLHAKTWLIVFAVMMVYLAQLINLVGTGAFAQAIAASVGGSEDAFWLVAITAIETVAFSPPVSQIADYWGRRWAIIIPTFCGVVGSIIVARADSMNMAIGGNVVLSISYGAQPLLHAVASEVLTNRHRVTAQAAVNIGSGIGGIVGLLGGAVLTRHPDGFRNYWYLSAGAFAFSTILVFFVYTPPLTERQMSLNNKEKLHKLDWIGYILLTAGLVLFTTGLFVAENKYPWKSAHTLCPLSTGAMLLTIFVLFEWRVKKDGMVHHDLFSRDRNFAIALGCIFCEGLVLFSANGYLPYEVSVLYETDPLRTCLRFAVAFIVYATFCVAPAIYCHQTKRFRVPVLFAFTCFLVFCVCMSTLTPGSGHAAWAYPVFLGLGLAVALSSVVTAAQLSAPGYLIGTTSGLLIAARSLGGAIGLAIYTAIFKTRLTNSLVPGIAHAVLPLGLPESSLPALVSDIATGNIKALIEIPGVDSRIIQAALQAFKSTFANSVRGVWITAACFSFVALVAASFLIDPTHDFNMNIDAPAESQEALYGSKGKAMTEKQVEQS